MSLGDEIAEFTKLQRDKAKELLTPGCVWAICKEVDWDNKTMLAIGLQDELPYYDVQLGLGSYYRKPVVGSLVMLGVPELQGKETFLIEAENVTEFVWVDETGFEIDLNEGLMAINGTSFKGIVKAPELKTQVDKNTAILKAIQQAINSWSPLPNDGGAAFKAQLASVPTMQRADLSNIQNETIQHGDGN